MMNENDSSYTKIDEYINQFPSDIQVILNEIRETIRKAAPEAIEKISYQMPCYYLYGNLVYYAAYKKHIGFYPLPSVIDAFQEELSQYKRSKGAVQFPLNQPMPLDLIRRIVQFRAVENLQISQAKTSKK